MRRRGPRIMLPLSARFRPPTLPSCHFLFGAYLNPEISLLYLDTRMEPISI